MQKTANRLAALEDEFAAIERITKDLRRRVDAIAETVRIATDVVRRHAPAAPPRSHPRRPSRLKRLRSPREQTRQQ